MHTARINADHLQLVLVTRRMPTVPSQWCVMSQHVHVGSCAQRGGGYRIPQESVAGPMCRGDFWRVLDRVSCEGAKHVRQVFGAGIRALRAEPKSFLPKA